MYKILTINSGSTSIKYKLFSKEKEDFSLIKGGVFENIKKDEYENTFKKILREIGDLRDLAAVGHRIVHGGSNFLKPTVINDEVINELEGLKNLAPLHNPYNIMGVKAAIDFLPLVKQVAVFDTNFYINLPEVAQIYALPKRILDDYGIRRYGFHGLSHEYAAEQSALNLKKDLKELNLITCHFGGGWSITAIKKGFPIDTSMGFTPMEGLPMMTRSGDIDPGIIFELVEREAEESCHGGLEKVKKMINFDSGIKGLSGIDNFRDLLQGVSLGRSKAKLAFDFVIYRVVKYIGSYIAALEGRVDAIVFTGAVGAGNSMTRDEIKKKLKYLKDMKYLKVEPNEELQIARKALKTVME